MFLFHTATIYDTESTCFCTATVYGSAVHVSVLLKYKVLQYIFLYCYNTRHCSPCFCSILYSTRYCSMCFCTATVHDAVHVSVLVQYRILQYMFLYCYSTRHCSPCFCSILLQYTIMQYMLVFHTATVYDTESTGLYCYSTQYCSMCFCTATVYDTAVHVSVPYCYSIRYCSTCFCSILYSI